METTWYTVIALMLTAYVVLDGFDFGVGILHLLVAKTDTVRRTIFAAIGPVWDGNEVWLIASGGVLVYSFPKVYAAGFSGFYLPLMMVLWLLILRGLSIELRSHEASPLWRTFFDGLFAFSSTLMAVILGAALGNVVRGVPLTQEGYFRGPLFTNFLPGGHNTGILDWYTVLVGIFSTALLAAHGAVYLIWKTGGAVQQRCKNLAPTLWRLTVVLGLIVTGATAIVQPSLFSTLASRPLAWVTSLLLIGSLVMLFVGLKNKRELPAFLASCGVIAGSLATIAAGHYPNLLTSTMNPAFNLSVHNAATGSAALQVGLGWWLLAIVLAIGYFIYLFHLFRGKVEADAEGQGY